MAARFSLRSSLSSKALGYSCCHARDVSNAAPRSRYDVAIVGGGVMGCSSAYFLASRIPGRSVCVLERDPTYKKASSMLSAASIRQQFSCTENIQMSLYSSQFLKNIHHHLSIEGEEPPDVSFVEGGYLFLATEAGESIMRENYAVQRDLGADVQLLVSSQLNVKFPWLNTKGIVLASYGYKGEGWFDPWMLLSSFKKKAISLGVDFIPGDVTGISVEGNKVKSIEVKCPPNNHHTIECNYMVNVGGPWAADVAHLAGIGKKDHACSTMRVELPVRPRLRSVFVLRCPTGPVSDCPMVIDGIAYWRRDSSDTFIAGCSPPKHLDRDADGVELDVNHALFEEYVWPKMANRVPAFEALKVLRAWAGFYEYNTLDQNGIIGAHPVLNNFVFANGFSGHGIQQSPAVGRAVSEVILDGRSHSIDLSGFSFQRIVDNKPHPERYVV